MTPGEVQAYDGGYRYTGGVHCTMASGQSRHARSRVTAAVDH